MYIYIYIIWLAMKKCVQSYAIEILFIQEETLFTVIKIKILLRGIKEKKKKQIKLTERILYFQICEFADFDERKKRHILFL